ncbi:MAG: ABC transporter permease [Lachnospiraceae bacterium]|nr:ABC transporter permease [Lachnospiraceae bacterium]
MTVLRKVTELAADIYEDRQLLKDLSLKDVKRRFSGTYFGMVWGVLQPLLTIIVYWAVFQFGFRSGDVDDAPFVLWFITGMISWLFISEAFATASNSFVEYNYLIQKVKFNINILPLMKIFSSFYIHLFFLLIALVICALFGFYPQPMLLQIVYYMFAEIMFLFALSLITSSVLVFFRDLNQIISIFLLMGMWGTPIAWNITNFPEDVQKVLMVNPFYYLVEGYRDAILGRQWFWEKTVLGIRFWVITLVLLVVGTSVYTRLKPYFADTV